MIVALMVTATSGLPDMEQGLATGLATMTQEIGITLGIPIMSAMATARTSALGGPHAQAVLGGVRLAVLVNVAIVATGTLPTGLFLRRRSTS